MNQKTKIPCYVLVVQFLFLGLPIPVFAHFSIAVNIFLTDFYIKDINLLSAMFSYFPVIFIVFFLT